MHWPRPAGPMSSINFSMRALGTRYKSSGVQGIREHGTREYGNWANRTLTSYMTVAKSHRTTLHSPRCLAPGPERWR